MTAHTIKEYKRFLLGPVDRVLGEREIEGLVLTDLAALNESGRSHGKYGGQRTVSSARQFFKYLKDSGVPMRFHWRDITVPSVPDPEPQALTEEEFEIAMQIILELRSSNSLRMRALFEVMYATGMRIGEALALKRVDVPWQTKELRITNNKTKEPCTVYFTDRSLNWLKMYLDARKDNNPALFVSIGGHTAIKRPAVSHFICDHLKPILDKRIGKNFHTHILRKTFVTHLLEGGVDIKNTQYLARHKSERTTLHNYAAVNKKKARVHHTRVLDRPCLSLSSVGIWKNERTETRLKTRQKNPPAPEEEAVFSRY